MEIVTRKTAIVIRDYNVKFKGYDIVVKAGTIVSNRTACGPNDCYRFPRNPEKIAQDSGHGDSKTLIHDLDWYGVNVPAEFCEPWDE